MADDRRTESEVAQPGQLAARVLLLDGRANHFDGATVHVLHVLLLDAVGRGFTGGFEFVQDQHDILDAEGLEVGVGSLTKRGDQGWVFKQLLIGVFLF